MSTASRSSSGSAERGRQRVREVGRARRRRRAITEAMKLRALVRDVLTSSSAAFGLSLPAWTSTRATPERAECGASARVSTLQALESCWNRDDHRRSAGRCKRRVAPTRTPTIHGGVAARASGAKESRRMIWSG